MTHNNIQPKYFSDYFNIEKSKLDDLGVFDPILNHDTPVFIDPFLLRDIKNTHFQNSYQSFKNFFRKFLKIIKMSLQEGDMAWRAAYKQLNDYMGEYRYSCIGFGTEDTGGRGSGKKISYKLLQKAKEIIGYDPDDPEIFSLLPLFEKDIGADRISDMTQNIIDGDICAYTEWVLNELGLQGNCLPTNITLDKSYRLLKNPFSSLPIKLLPKSLLTNLPVAANMGNAVYETTSHNEYLRNQISNVVGKEWEDIAKKEAIPKIFKQIESDNPFFVELLKNIKKITVDAYNLSEDTRGLHRWLGDALKFDISTNNIDEKQPIHNINDLYDIVISLIEAFTNQINQGLYQLYWKKDKNIFQHVKQSYSENIFFQIFRFFCSNTNNHIDFSSGDEQLKHYIFSCKKMNVKVIICHSDNHHLKSKYEQLIKKINNANNIKAIMIVINFKDKIQKPLKDLRDIRNPICPIYEVNIPEPNEGDIFTEYEGENESEIRLFKMQQRGGNKRRETTNNIKNKIIAAMYPIIASQEKHPTYQNIGSTIHDKLISLDEEKIDKFMQENNISSEYKQILLDAKKYCLNGGSQINEWCRKIKKGEKP